MHSPQHSRGSGMQFLGRCFTGLCLLLTLGIPFGAARAAGSDDAQRLGDAREAFQALMATPDSAVPAALLDKCRAVAIFPGIIKAGLGVGGTHGHGVICCRTASGGWSTPAFLTMTGGSYGLQIGVEKTQLVLFFMSDKSVHSLFRSKFKLGANAGLAAGPVGRSADASTDLKLNAEIYSYARSKGAYAGLTIEGAVVSADENSNREYYGKTATASALAFRDGAPDPPAPARALMAALPGSPHNP